MVALLLLSAVTFEMLNRGVIHSASLSNLKRFSAQFGAKLPLLSAEFFHQPRRRSDAQIDHTPKTD